MCRRNQDTPSRADAKGHKGELSEGRPWKVPQRHEATKALFNAQGHPVPSSGLNLVELPGTFGIIEVPFELDENQVLHKRRSVCRAAAGGVPGMIAEHQRALFDSHNDSSLLLQRTFS